MLGTALGVIGLRVSVALIAVALVGIVVFLLRRSSQVVFAALMLTWLGFVWAVASGGGGQARIVDCKLVDAVKFRIVGPVQVQEKQVRFVAESTEGCRIMVSTSRFADFGEGDVVELTGGELQTLAEVRDYSAGYARYLERQGITATWQYPVVQSSPGESRSTGVRAWISMLRKAVRARVTLLFVEPDASVVLAVLFAERGTLPSVLVEQFRATGVSHVLAISGLHISLLIGMLVGLVLLLPIGPKGRTALALVLLWSYIIFIGAPTSAVRAAAFWTVTLTALRLYLLVSLPTVLLLAGGALVSLRPQYLTDIGFQLSISAVAGIFLALFLAQPLLEVIADKNGLLVVRWLLTLFIVSIGATLATGPIVAYHFGNVALAGVVTNLLVVPFVPVMLLLAILALLLSLVFIPAALAAAFLLHEVIAWISLVTRVISSVPGLFWENVTVSLWFITGYYLVLAVTSIAILRWQDRSWREVWG